jgi:hypothetical protein
MVWGIDSVPESGNRVLEIRPLQTTNAVRFAMSGELVVRFGDKQELELEADENMLPLIETEVRNGELIISMASGSWMRTKEKLRGTLTLTTLDAVHAASSGDIRVADWSGKHILVASSSSGDVEVESIDATSVDLRSSSSGDIRVGKISTKKLRADLGSSGDIRIGGGKSSSQLVRISSSGDYVAHDMVSLNADIRSSSSGDASVWVTRRLRTSKSSGGDIRVKGNPATD